MRRTVVTLLALVVAALVGAGTARAQVGNTTIARAANAMLGQSLYTRVDTVDGDNGTSLENQSYFRVHLRATRSYAVFCVPVDGDGSTGNCQTSWRNAADAEVGTDINNAEPLPPGGDADAFIPASTGFYYIRTENHSDDHDEYLVYAIETTLFSPWYFVSSSDRYDGFIEVKNTTVDTLPIVVTVYNNAGGVVGTPRADSLDPNGNEVYTTTSFGVTNGFGSVQIAHLGLFGASTANITTLSARTGLSFDAPFDTRGGAQANFSFNETTAWAAGW